ncbi:ribonuclease III domain-containing protein [Acaryochloris sp. IP29b_bin.137]|uniref:Mini-ribonuclease 3 n=1 Tax=Acaryochloris sp. IP29b_bin.137 TaxID=2969217 RepID=UPI002632F4B5|nr:ribonuclease III domain-containing protein [Acaryochloris sp. IP29b_bin.137]
MLYSLPFSFLQLTSLSPTEVRAISPTALAYIGDAVYELFIRRYYLLPPSRLRDYHQKVVACVRAEAQAEIAQELYPLLSGAEQAILKQGRNAAVGGPRRTNPVTYQYATGFETLIGYLYLTDPPRLEELLAQIKLDPSTSNSA